MVGLISSENARGGLEAPGELEVPLRLTPLQRPGDDPTDLLAEAPLDLLGRQHPESDGDLAEAQGVVPRRRPRHLVDHLHERFVREHALTHQETTEALPRRVVLCEHRPAVLEVDLRPQPLGANLEEPRAAIGDELEHRLDQREGIAGRGRHRIG